MSENEKTMNKYETLKIILRNIKHPVLLVLFLFLFASMQPLFAYGISVCIDNINSRFHYFMLVTVCIAIVGLFSEILSGKLLINEVRNIELFMQRYLIDNFCRMQPGRLEDEIKSGYFMKFYRDCAIISSAFKVLLPFFIVAITNLFIIAIIVLLKNSVLLLCLMILPFLFCGFFLYPYKKNISVANCDMINAQDRTAENLLHFFSVFANMKVNAAEAKFAQKAKDFFTNQNEAVKRVELLDFNFEFKLKSISIIFKCILLASTGTMAAKGFISLGDVVLYQLLLSHVADAFGRSMTLVQFIGTYGEAFNSFVAGLSNFHLEEKKADLKKVKLAGNIRLDNVTLSYAEKSVISNVSAEIKAGKFVVVKGDNGTGKSTMLKLLATFHKPSFGNVFFNDVNSSDIDLFDLRKQIFYISQNQQILDVSFLENITLGEIYSDKHLLEVIEKSGLKELYDQTQKQNIDQSQYSGGELQRIAIAQAMLRSPKILFIDELENHLDDIGYNIYVNWLKEMKGFITLIVVSHKKEIINLADQIFDLNVGSLTVNDSVNEGIYHDETKTGNGGLL